MGDDRPPADDRLAIAAELPPALRRLLLGYAATADRVRAAEVAYHDGTASVAASLKGGPRRGAQIAMAEAFERLADAVVELQEGRAAVRSQSEAENLSPGALLTLDDALAIAGGDCDGYLAARTYEQVREVAGRRHAV